MNRGKLTILSVTIALLMVAALFLSFFLSGWNKDERPSISLPPNNIPVGQPDGIIPEPAISFAPTIPIELGTGSAREVVATLERSTQYQCDLQVTWFWPEGQSTQGVQLSVRDELFAIERWTTPGRIELKLLGNDERLLWWIGDGGAVHDGKRGEASLDDLCAIPTYESLLSLPDGAITDIGYQATEQGKYLAVQAFDGTYYGQYLLSVETGLLQQAAFYDTPDAAGPVYRMNMTRFAEGDPGDRFFTQPNGEVGV